MITANLAGSASSHLRSGNDRGNNHNSRSNLNCGDDSDTGSNCMSRQHKATECSEENWHQDSDLEKRMCRMGTDYKTWLYLSCVACVIIGTLVLIVLLAMGIISLNPEDNRWSIAKPSCCIWHGLDWVDDASSPWRRLDKAIFKYKDVHYFLTIPCLQNKDE